MERGRVDFQNRNCAEDEHHAQQRPVEIAETQNAAHQGWPSLKRSGTTPSHAGKGSWPEARALGFAACANSKAGLTKKWPACRTEFCQGAAARLRPGGAGVDQTAPTSTGL